jgi:hypothetical protein
VSLWQDLFLLLCELKWTLHLLKANSTFKHPEMVLGMYCAFHMLQTYLFFPLRQEDGVIRPHLKHTSQGSGAFRVLQCTRLTPFVVLPSTYHLVLPDCTALCLKHSQNAFSLSPGLVLHLEPQQDMLPPYRSLPGGSPKLDKFCVYLRLRKALPRQQGFMFLSFF